MNDLQNPDENYIEYLKKSDLPLVLYGAGDVAQSFFEKVIVPQDIAVNGVIVSNEYYRPNSTFHGLSIQPLEKILNESLKADIILCFRESNYDHIVKELKNIAPDCNFFIGYGIKLKRDMLRFEVHICDHCNLNCKSCDHFSPIAEKRFVDLDILQRDFSRLSQLSNRKCEVIDLMGGEPLLHPKIIEVFDIARKHFDTTVRLVTNGILLANQPDEFWKNCDKNRITILVSAYPIQINEKKIKAQAHKFGVTLEQPRQKFGEKDWYQRWTPDFTGSRNILTAFRNCDIGNVCLFLEDGKLATCGLPLYAKHFNKYFNHSEVKFDEPTQEDYVDIFKVSSLDEILTKVARPIPYCRYCKPDNVKFGKWGPSERKMEEWI